MAAGRIREGSVSIASGTACAAARHGVSGSVLTIDCVAMRHAISILFLAVVAACGANDVRPVVQAPEPVVVAAPVFQPSAVACEPAAPSVMDILAPPAD